MLNPYIAFNRFGLGATPALAKLNATDAKEWLYAQLKDYVIPAPSWSSEQALQQLFAYRRAQKSANKLSKAMAKEPEGFVTNNAMAINPLDANTTEKALQESRRLMFENNKALSRQIIQQAIITDQPLLARLLDFFSNHFSVSNNNSVMRAVSSTLDIEAISPHLNGYFSGMLVAVTQHPSMLYYLNNENSIGPNSKIGKRRKKGGLNENLGREILELHTLGVSSGYTQNDVQALSKGLTGWTIGGQKLGQPVGFIFKANTHEPGDKVLLGKRYAFSELNDQQQAVNMLVDLAQHDKTAQHLCYKLAKHFIADSPPPDLVKKMTAHWIKTKGHIFSVVKVMIDHPDSWSNTAQKFKTPREYVISVCRACQLNTTKPDIMKTLEILGQAPFSSGSPAGYSDDAKDWASAAAIMNRIEWADHIAGQVKSAPNDVAEIALGGLLKAETAKQIQRAESKRQGLSLLFMSPEFLRR